MKKAKLEEKIAEYLNGEMSLQQKEELKEFLKQTGYEFSELSDLENLFKQLDEFHVPEPSEKMDDRFYLMLDEFKVKASKIEQRQEKAVSIFQSFFPQKYIPQVAYSLLLLIIGWAAGTWILPNSRYENQLFQMSSQIREMRQVVMLTMIDQPSVTERIKAVNIANNFDKVDDKIINALLYTLNNDPNENVRIITVEALVEFANDPRVREGLIQSITKQESPLVQIALADAMLTLQEKKAVEQFNRLLEKKDLNDTVRNRLEKTVTILM